MQNRFFEMSDYLEEVAQPDNVKEEQRKQIEQMRQGFGRGGRGGRGPGPDGRGPGGEGPGGGPERRGPGNPGNPFAPDDGPSRDRLH